jgi:hypothetical protein
VRILGRLVEVEPAQAARLEMAQASAHGAITRVRELDPTWRPRPSAYESVEGLIRTYEAEAREAEARIVELGRVGIGPGPFAAESIRRAVRVVTSTHGNVARVIASFPRRVATRAVRSIPAHHLAIAYLIIRCRRHGILSVGRSACILSVCPAALDREIG